ncbi:MAG TPA: glycerol-3-phosphate dehydrogenase/oxidase [Gaiellales bacterium]|jgi:glycerol-3-phosphate dehydrogenase|nr:glycerol-3-phosphate dehydrogenase/oxidase [Gaiellales bacterium]
MPAPADARGDALETLAGARFDLLVVGGGIVGCAVAWLGARAGLRVALVERGDLAGVTSSASSKLIHGGLRYLQMGDIRLVREAHAERHALARVVAPHLVRPRAFLVPVYRSGPVRATTLRAGLVLYGGLGRFQDGGGSLLRPAAARALVPPLRTAGLRSAGRYVDHETNDARLTIAVARAAALSGACIATRVEVRSLRVAGGRVAGAECADTAAGAEFPVDATCVVNATGPWVDELRRMADPAAPRSLRFAKGAHLVVRLDEPWRAALTTPLEGGRVQFANPWEGALLVGTTDEPYEGDPRDLEVTDADVEQIVRESRASIEPGVVERERILSSFAGVRVLPQGDGETPSARRETVFVRGEDGMLSIAGGKFTTFRRIALDALEQLRGDLDLRALERTPVPLPGAADPDAVAERLLCDHPSLEPASARHLARFHGSDALELLAAAREDPALLEPLAPGAPEVAAQVPWAREREWALTADDVLARRTTLASLGRAEDARARVEELLR